MRFTKMHGIGNDYVYVSTFDQRRRPTRGAGRRRSRPALRHRRRRPDPDLPSERADARMRMFNADGSEVGDVRQRRPLRRQVRLRPRHRAASRESRIETGRGVLTLDLEVDGEQGPPRARRHGRADLQAEPRSPRPYPATRRSTCRSTVGGQTLMVTAVSMGNPHVVLTSRRQRFPWKRRRRLEQHPSFPRRVNVHFVEVQGPGRSPDADLGARLRHHPGLRHRRLRRLRRGGAHGRPAARFSLTSPAAISSSNGPPTRPRLHDRAGRRRSSRANGRIDRYARISLTTDPCKRLSADGADPGT